MIVTTFETEKDLFNSYPKTNYFKLKDIFNDYWENFLVFAKEKNLKIRDVVIRDVNRMIICNTSTLGTSVFKCPKCNNTKLVYNTCKSRFCNSCGIKYAKQRALNIESKLISREHRHLVFTISDILWPLFLKKRDRLNFMFEAVSKTLISWYGDKYKKENLKPCFVLTLHTFWYQRHEDDNFVVEKIHIFEFIARLIRHIPEPQFKTIRYYGFYAFKSHKLYNACRKLISKEKLPFYKSLNKWRNLLLITFKKDPLICDICSSVMEFNYGYT